MLQGVNGKKKRLAVRARMGVGQGGCKEGQKTKSPFQEHAYEPRRFWRVEGETPLLQNRIKTHSYSRLEEEEDSIMLTRSEIIIPFSRV